ncbi:MAG: fumarate hydratase [Chloroflexi bacterium]|nr:fumarate hydratase [Chloroflexota bacterium]
MKEIDCRQITQTIARLCQEANFFLPEDVIQILKQAKDKEESPAGRDILGQILQNAELAAREKMPLCQDCGAAVLLLEVGQEVHVTGGYLMDAVQEGVRQGYTREYLRRSMVRQPFSDRVNTRDNTPAVIHTEIVPGDLLKITVMPKGGGSENMSRLFMLEPSQGREGVVRSVLKAVVEAGSNPCPPIIVGVGIGGTAEKSMIIAKKALSRSVGQPHPDAEVATLERELLEKVNALGIGPEGFGGTVTALGVHVETFPAHIASLPVAVNLQCHSARHKEATL